LPVATIRAWLRRGVREGRGPYASFARDFDRVSAVPEANAVRELRAHGRKDWFATATYLERRFPQRWARPPARVILRGYGDEPASRRGAPRFARAASEGPDYLTRTTSYRESPTHAYSATSAA